MKKYVSVLMLVFAALMFFGCDNGGDDDGGSSSVIPATYTLGAGASYTFSSKTDFSLSTSDDDSYIVEANGKTITGVGAIGKATVIAKDADGKELAKCVVTIKPISMTIELEPSKWAQNSIPQNLNNNSGAETEYAATSYANGVLTLTFKGKNRQRAAIPLTAEQDKILQSEFSRLKNGVTFRIDATATISGTKPSDYDYFTVESAGFRLHIGDPSVPPGKNGVDGGTATWWNATAGSGIMEGPFPHTPEFRNFDHAFDVLDPDKMVDDNEPWSNFKTLLIQAMFKNSDGSSSLPNSNPDYPEVKVAIRSLRIDIGDTRTPDEIPQ